LGWADSACLGQLAAQKGFTDIGPTYLVLFFSNGLDPAQLRWVGRIKSIPQPPINYIVEREREQFTFCVQPKWLSVAGRREMDGRRRSSFGERVSVVIRRFN